MHVSRVLIANRGEIACRVARACRALGLEAVAVFSDADAHARHVRHADAAVRIGPGPSAESYLHVERLLDAARRAGCDAVHPGYGFLAERAHFARAVEAAGLVWVGPPPAAIDQMGDKVAARRLAATLGVPVADGLDEHDGPITRSAAAALGFPLLVKAAAGGGGRGMRVVRHEGELDDALVAARREAEVHFGDGALLIERYLERARHIEVQVLADRHGHVVHLGERDCSVQRRRQKVWEEAPAPGLDADLRARLGASAVTLARAVGYVGAGTVECLVDGTGRHVFIEMNTRIQVEHPVTEQVTGVDLVREQLRVAMGHPLPKTLVEGRMCGSSIEVRLVAEDPLRGYQPSQGRLLRVDLPADDGVRIEAGYDDGDVVPVHYDGLVAKIIATGADRDEALGRLRRALRAAWAPGLPTNLPLLRELVDHPDVRAGRVHTRWLEDESGLPTPPPENALLGVIFAAALTHTTGDRPWPVRSGFRIDGDRGAADDWQVGAATLRASVRRTRDHLVVHADGRDHVVAAQILEPGVARIDVDGHARRVRYVVRRGDAAHLDAIVDGDVVYLHFGDGEAFARLVPRLPPPAPPAPEPGTCVAPMPGTVRQVHVVVGATVAKGDRLVTIEAMKVEQALEAPHDGVVAEVRVAVGVVVAAGDRLVRLTSPSDEA
jgi:3-methylcrotonyl-CoA carboxylase alpha subunit